MIILASVKALEYIPTAYTTTTSVVHCDNGKAFDPESKPIYPNGDEPFVPRYSDIRHRQLSSECEYGTAYYVGDVIPHPKNYSEVTTSHENWVGSWSQTSVNFMIYLLGGLFIVEIVKRLLYYIIFAESPTQKR
jgi:hypothetical protein